SLRTGCPLTRAPAIPCDSTTLAGRENLCGSSRDRSITALPNANATPSAQPANTTFNQRSRPELALIISLRFRQLSFCPHYLTRPGALEARVAPRSWPARISIYCQPPLTLSPREERAGRELERGAIGLVVQTFAVGSVTPRVGLLPHGGFRRFFYHSSRWDQFLRRSFRPSTFSNSHCDTASLEQNSLERFHPPGRRQRRRCVLRQARHQTSRHSQPSTRRLRRPAGDRLSPGRRDFQRPPEFPAPHRNPPRYQTSRGQRPRCAPLDSFPARLAHAHRRHAHRLLPNRRYRPLLSTRRKLLPRQNRIPRRPRRNAQGRPRLLGKVQSPPATTRPLSAKHNRLALPPPRSARVPKHRPTSSKT